MIKQLIDVMGELQNVYESIYRVSLSKKDHIVANDIQKVGETVKQEWELLGDASALDEKRAGIVKEIAQQHGVAEEGVSLHDICAWGTPEEDKRLHEISERMNALLNDQKKLNAENQSLINLHLEYMDYMINMFLVEPQVSSIYGNSGEVDEGGAGNKRIIDSQV